MRDRKTGQHQERAQIHGTYGISDSAVENPPLRSPRLGYPRYRHNDDKSALEERSYLIPGVRTYRLDHGKLIMDEAHRVHDPNFDSGTQNQKRSDADHGIDARRLPDEALKAISDGLRANDMMMGWKYGPRAGAQGTPHGVSHSPSRSLNKEADNKNDKREMPDGKLDSELAKRLGVPPGWDQQRAPAQTTHHYRPVSAT